MCECFICKNRNNVDLLYGYFKSSYEDHKYIYNYLKDLGYKCGSLSDKDGIPQLMAILSYEVMSSGCLLQEMEDKFNSKNIQDKITNYMLEGDGYSF